MTRLAKKDLTGFWRCVNGLHPTTPRQGLLTSFVIRCDTLPKSSQIKLCQQRIKQQRGVYAYMVALGKKEDMWDVQAIINEEKERIFQLIHF